MPGYGEFAHGNREVSRTQHIHNITVHVSDTRHHWGHLRTNMVCGSTTQSGVIRRHSKLIQQSQRTAVSTPWQKS
jgi:hypothetical protein